MITFALWVAVASATAQTTSEVFVIEQGKSGRIEYRLRDKPIDSRQPLTDIRKMLGRIDSDEPRIFVLLGEHVPLDEAFRIGFVFEKIGLQGVRYFHFSRSSGVMTEIKLDPHLWRLSFDGSLVEWHP